MEQEEILHTISGKEFKFRIQDRDNINVMSAGYIITPNGEFVDIKDNENHEDIFSKYINNYLENTISVKYSLFRAIQILLSYNHIIYYGIKETNLKNLYSNLGEGNGYAYMFLPDSLDDLENDQKECCTKLLSTNRSLFGNYDKINLKIEQFNKEKNLTAEEFIDKLTTKISRR